MEQCRKLISTHQFNNEPLRIMLAVLASGLPATDFFITSPFQKHLFREIKMSDAAVKGRGIQWNAQTRRYAFTGRAADDVDEEAEPEEDEIRADVHEKFAIPEKPTKDNAVMAAIYGLTCTAVRSYQSALCTCPRERREWQPGLTVAPSLPAACARLLSERSDGVLEPRCGLAWEGDAAPGGQ